ncbi:hypothetical protein C1I98_25140 [Spongiactinospora gelatinilytica]|uniref:Uncharacterized protein n=1 Tax=Spongiactinospora gelatinilytica TaxID=2666298 RepID=A0A2W2GB78_9ACTN|nr:hypothetical protein [Spongiactinospora gelatinilytica]PZG37525.1 hypothetical protein C1I98_25140 [Spongiactinospora gelatinilytica]
MDAFMLAYPHRRPPGPTAPEDETAHRLKDALAAHGIHAFMARDRGGMLVSLCFGLVAVVKADGIWWHSPRQLRPGIPLYVHRGTVPGAVEALVRDYALLNPAAGTVEGPRGVGPA